METAKDFFDKLQETGHTGYLGEVREWLGRYKFEKFEGGDRYLLNRCILLLSSALDRVVEDMIPDWFAVPFLLSHRSEFYSTAQLAEHVRGITTGLMAVVVTNSPGSDEDVGWWSCDLIFWFENEADAVNFNVMIRAIDDPD